MPFVAVRGLGTVVNFAAVAVGASLGVLVGNRLAERVCVTLMHALGLVTVAVAVTGLDPLRSAEDGLRRFIIVIAGLILGALVGEGLRLEDRLESLASRLKARFHVAEEGSPSTVSSPFVEGFVIATTLFCVGPLAVLGAIEDGLGTSIRLLAIKSALDGISSVGLASVYGWGVLVAGGALLLYQGAITGAALALTGVVTSEVIALLGAVGSMLVMAIGFRLLDIVRIRVLNLLPALFLAPALGALIETVR